MQSNLQTGSQQILLSSIGLYMILHMYVEKERTVMLASGLQPETFRYVPSAGAGADDGGEISRALASTGCTSEIRNPQVSVFP